jgi:hypothetical protein
MPCRSQGRCATAPDEIASDLSGAAVRLWPGRQSAKAIIETPAAADPSLPADGGTTSTGASNDASPTATAPPHTPDGGTQAENVVDTPRWLTPDQIPPEPQATATCEDTAAGPTKYPGPCGMLSLYAGEPRVSRGTFSWVDGVQTASQTESWSPGYYERQFSNDVRGPEGVLFTYQGEDKIDDSRSHWFASSTRARTQFIYDAGRLTRSIKLQRSAGVGPNDPNGDVSNDQLYETDDYFVDARNAVFVGSRNVAVVTGYTYFPAQFTTYENGDVQSAEYFRDLTIDGKYFEMTDTQFFDVNGVLTSETTASNDLVQNVAYTYEGARLLSVETTNVQGEGQTTSTTYGYDDAGNNVSRVFSVNGQVSQIWNGHYDGAGNLVCAQSFNGDPQPQLTVHYDYSCFR